MTSDLTDFEFTGEILDLLEPFKRIKATLNRPIKGFPHEFRPLVPMMQKYMQRIESSAVVILTQRTP